MSRSRLRAEALDPNDSFSFANVTIDGYSGECLNEGYKPGLIFTDGPGGSVTLTLYADDGSIIQDGTGLVSFNGDLVVNAYVASDLLPKITDAYMLGDPTHEWLDGYFKEIHLSGEGYMESLHVSGDTFLNGDVNLGDSSADCVVFNASVCSDIYPCCTDAYQFGDPTHRWLDGYFKNLYVENEFVNNITVTNFDSYGFIHFHGCASFFGGVCSDIIPCCDDAYQLGSPTKEWKDGYFKEIHLSGEGYMESLHVSGDAFLNNLNITGLLTVEDFTATGDVTLGNGPEDCIKFNGVICSDIIPCCDDAYQIGDPTHRFSDGYFVNLWADVMHVSELIIDYTTIHNLDVDGYANFHGLTTFYGCVDFEDGLCSDIIPCCNDAYQLGDPTHEFRDGYFKEIHLSGEGYMESLHVSGPGYFQDVTVSNLLTTEDLKVDGYVVSDLLPLPSDTYMLGDPTHAWLDGYFTLFSPNNYSVSTINSLTAHLQGIDDALANISHVVFKHVAYVVTASEASSDSVDTTRTVDQGIQFDVCSYTDVEFRDSVYIYLDGQLLLNDPVKRANTGAVTNDVARSSTNPCILLFSRNVKKCSIIQVVATV